MKTGEDTIFGSICANSEIWQNRVDHTFDNMVVLNSISLVENDVLIKWTNKVDKSEKPGGPQNFFSALIWKIGCLIRQFGWHCCDIRVVHPNIIISNYLSIFLILGKENWANAWAWSTLEPAILLKVALLHGCFSRFLICINGTKSRKASHIWNLFEMNSQWSSVTS